MGRFLARQAGVGGVSRRRATSRLGSGEIEGRGLIEVKLCLGGPRAGDTGGGRCGAAVIELRSPRIAEYLTAPFIVVRSGHHRIGFSEFDRWGEALAPEDSSASEGEAHLSPSWEILRRQDGVRVARGTTEVRESSWTIGDFDGLVDRLVRASDSKHRGPFGRHTFFTRSSDVRLQRARRPLSLASG